MHTTDGGLKHLTNMQDLSKLAYTGIASALPTASMLSSGALELFWRVSFYADSSEFGPRKPFWRLKAELRLTKAQVQRIV
jgi:hypothetical protein